MSDAGSGIVAFSVRLARRRMNAALGSRRFGRREAIVAAVHRTARHTATGNLRMLRGGCGTCHMLRCMLGRPRR